MVVVSVLPRSVRVVVIVVSCSIISPRVLELAEVRVEPLEALIPVRPVLADPVRDVTQRSGHQPPRTPLGLPAALDEPRPLEHTEVLRDRGLAELERGRQVLHRCLAVRQTAK